MVKEKSDKEIYESLLEYVKNHGACPQPICWDKLFCMLKDKNNAKLKNPLILNGWIMSTIPEKIIRFREHLEWAYEHGQIKDVDRYLRSLSEDEWY